MFVVTEFVVSRNQCIAFLVALPLKDLLNTVCLCLVACGQLKSFSRFVKKNFCRVVSVPKEQKEKKSRTPKVGRTTKRHEVWTQEDKDVFFEALAEVKFHFSRNCRVVDTLGFDVCSGFESQVGSPQLHTVLHVQDGSPRIHL